MATEDTLLEEGDQQDQGPGPKKNKTVKPVTSVWDSFEKKKPDQLLKKGDGSQPGTTKTSPSSSKSTSSPKSVSDVWDAIDTNKVDVKAVTPDDSLPEPEKIPSSSNNNSGGLGDILNPLNAVKTPTVNIAGQQVPLNTNIPFEQGQKFADDLQVRIDAKTFGSDDVETVAKAMKVSPMAANAFMNNKTSTGLLIDYNDKKEKTKVDLENAVADFNKRFAEVPEDAGNMNNGLVAKFGQPYDIKQVLSSPETASDFLEKYKSAVQQVMSSKNASRHGVYANPADKEKLQKYFDDIEKSFGINSKLIADKILDDVLNDESISKDQKVRKVANLIDKTNFKNNEDAIAERLTPVNYLMKEAAIGGNTTKEDIDLLNSSKANVELAISRKTKDNINYNAALKGAIIEQLNEKIAQAKTDDEKNTLQQAAQKQIDAIDLKIKNLSLSYDSESQLQDKYPVLFKQELVSKLNDFAALRSGNVKGDETTPGFAQDDRSIQQFLKDEGYDINDQKVKDILTGDNFKDYSFFGRPLQNISDVFVNSVKAIGDFTPYRDKADILAEKNQSQLFSNQVGDNEKYTLTKAAFVGQNIGNTTGQVIGQGALQAATAGLGRMVGLSQVAAVNTAFWSSGALTSYDQAYKDSYDFIESKAGRVAYAGLIALSNAASEKIFPDIKLFQIPGVREHIADLSSKIGKEGFNEELAKELLGKVKSSVIAYGKEFGKEVTQETVEEVSTQLFEDGLRYLYGDPNANWDNAMENAKNTAIQTALGMAGIGAYGAHKSVREEKNTSPKATIYNAALYHDEAIDAINIGFANGLYNQDEVNSKISVLNTAKDALAVTDKTLKTAGIEMKRPEKELYVANLTAEALLTRQLKEINTKEGVVDVFLRKGLEEKISNLQNQRSQLLKNEVAIDDNGDIVPPAVYMVEGKPVKKDEFLSKMNGPDADNLELSVEGDDEVSALLEKKGGKTEEVPAGNGKPQRKKNKIESAVIEIGGKTYEGKNHAEAILKAKADGQDISQVDRKGEGKFKLSDGTVIDRAEAKDKFGADRAEQLIPQDEAAKAADKEYGTPDNKGAVSSSTVGGENVASIEKRRQEEKDNFDPMSKPDLASAISKLGTTESWFALNPGSVNKNRMENAKKIVDDISLKYEKEIDAKYGAELAALPKAENKPIQSENKANEVQQPSDEELAKEIISSVKNLSSTANTQEAIDYAIDKAVENPATFQKDHPEIFEKIKDRIPTEKIESNLDFHIEHDSENPNVKILDDMLSERTIQPTEEEITHTAEQVEEQKEKVPILHNLLQAAKDKNEKLAAISTVNSEKLSGLLDAMPEDKQDAMLEAFAPHIKEDGTLDTESLNNDLQRYGNVSQFLAANVGNGIDVNTLKEISDEIKSPVAKVGNSEEAKIKSTDGPAANIKSPESNTQSTERPKPKRTVSAPSDKQPDSTDETKANKTKSSDTKSKQVQPAEVRGQQTVEDIEQERKDALETTNKIGEDKIKAGRENTKSIVAALKLRYPATSVKGIVVRLLEKLVDLNKYSTIIDSAYINGRNASGQATWFGMMISQETYDGIMNGKEHEVHTFIHEFFHGFTTSKLVGLSMESYIPGYKSNLSPKEVKAIEQLKRIFEKVKQALPNSKEYGLTNVDEFIAEAFSNESFQFTLKGIESEGKKSNLFKDFVKAIGDLLFEQMERWAKRFDKPIPSRDSVTGILEDVFAWAEDLIDQDNKLGYVATADEINAEYDAKVAEVRGQQIAEENKPIKMMGEIVKLKKSVIDEGVSYELYKGTSSDVSFVRVKDEDSGNIVSLKRYSNNELAEKRYNELAKIVSEFPEQKINDNEKAKSKPERDTATIVSSAEVVIKQAENATKEEEVDAALDNIEDHLNEIESKIGKLTEVYSTEGIYADYPSSVIGKKAKKEINKYAKSIAKQLGWTIPAKNGVYDNIAPAGGEVVFKFDIPGTLYQMYVQAKYEPEYITHYDNYTFKGFFYRLENPFTKGSDRYLGSNQWQHDNVSAKEMAQILKKEAGKYIGKQIQDKVSKSNKENSVTPYEFKPNQKDVDTYFNNSVKQYNEANTESQAVLKDIVIKSIARYEDALQGLTSDDYNSNIQGLSRIDMKVKLDAARKFIEYVNQPANTVVKRKVRDAEAQKAIDTAIAKFMKGGNPLTMGGLDPQRIEAGVELIGLYMKQGVYKFTDIVEDFYAKVGDTASDYFNALKSVYGTYRDGGATDEEYSEMDGNLRNFTYDNIIKSIQNDQNNTAVSDTNGADTSELDGTEPTSTSTESLPGEQATGETDLNSGASGQSDGKITKRGKDGRGSRRNSNSNNTGTRSGTEQAGESAEQSTSTENKNALRDVNAKNHVISDDDVIINKGEIAKIKGNIAAIKLAKALQEEDRNATPEEKKILAQFVGWGGLAPVLDESKARYTWEEAWQKKYADLHKQIKDILTPDEFYTAVNSTQNAHYTERGIIKSLWKLAEYLGFKGGDVSEPAMGSGLFFGLMPKSLQNNSNLTGYELDKLTGLIATKLYPEANIKITGFENSTEEKNSQDLIISNVPFAKEAPYDKNNKDLSKFSLHNYFIAKSIRQLKPGGIGIFITSMSSMDNRSASVKFREWTNGPGNADFIGAVRLPNDAFESNAGTQVTTDILIYRKRATDNPTELNQQYRNTVEISQVEYEGKPVPIEVNEYYAEHPEMMLGRMTLASEAGSGGLYGANAQTLVKEKGSDVQSLLDQRLQSLPSDIFGAEATTKKEKILADASDKNGAFKEKDGKIFINEDGQLVKPDWHDESLKGSDGKQYKKVVVAKQYLEVKNTVRDLINKEQSLTEDTTAIEEARSLLNKQYDSFVAKYGEFNNNRKLGFLQDDADYNSVFALEDIQKKFSLGALNRLLKTYSIEKSAIFNKRVNFPVQEPIRAENVQDGLSISISYRNSIDLKYISEMTGKTEDAVKAELLKDGLAFENPLTGNLEDRDSYLSGYVRTKYKEAVSAAAENEKYNSNVKELEKVVPKDLPASMIEFKLGSTWVPAKYVESFVKSQLGVSARIGYNTVSGTWAIGSIGNGHDPLNRITFGTSEFTGIELVEKALNLRQPIVSRTEKNAEGNKVTVRDIAATAEAQQKMQELIDAFYNTVKSDKEAMQELADIYNDKYNDFIEKKYSLPSFTHFPNAAKEIDGKNFQLRLHQRKAVIRILKDSTLLAHQVGTGKTYTMITAAMEMRRLGIAKKPMIVVQNSTLEQFSRDYKKLYPSANILTPTAKEMDAKNRQRLFNKIAYGDWDSVIIPQSFLDFIPDDENRERAYLNELIDEMKEALDEAESEGDRSAAGSLRSSLKSLEGQLEKVGEVKGKGRKVKDQARANQSAEKKFMKQADRRKDDVFTFEKMGVDALYIDEAHNYKKLGFLTKMMGIKGIDTGRSKRALGAYMKVKWVQEKNNGRNVVLATGTPITNTMAEVWTMMRFVSPDTLEKYGITTFDEFATTFGVVEPSLEFTTSGNFKIVDRFKSFINAPELGTAFRSKADVVLTEDVPEFKESNSIPKLKLQEQEDGTKKAGFTQVIIPQTDALKNKMSEIKKVLTDWQNLTGKQKKELSYIPLLMFNRAKQAAIDLRLIDPTAEDNPGSKTNAVVKEAFRIYNTSSDYKGTQFIFADNYQSPDQGSKYLDDSRTIINPAYGKGRFNLYEEIKNKLVAMGIPANEIANVNDYEKEKKDFLFEKVRNGEVRIVLGSTEKMGVGVNAQERMVALHHIDAPTRPMDFEQRNGRLLRQGNTHADMGIPVEVVTYGVEKTLDATAYQRLAIKQNFINQMLKGGGTDRVMSDEADEDNPSDLNHSQMMAQLSGSQYALVHQAKKFELMKIKTAKQNHERRIIDFNDTIRRNKQRIPVLEERYKEGTAIITDLKKTFPDGKITTVTVKGVDHVDKLTESIDSVLSSMGQRLISSQSAKVQDNFEINGLKVLISGTMEVDWKTYQGNLSQKDKSNNKQEYIKPFFSYSFSANADKSATNVFHANTIGSAQGLLASMNSAVRRAVEDGNLPEDNINDLPSRIEQYKKDNEVMEQKLTEPFPKEKKLAELEAELVDLEGKMEAETAENEKNDKEKENTSNEIDESAFSAKEAANDFQSNDKSPVTVLALAKKYPDAVVVKSQTDLPASVQLAAKTQGYTVEGVLHNGKVYLVADNLDDMGRAEGVYKHESIGHAGVIAHLKDKLDGFARTLVNNATTAQKIRLEALSQKLFKKQIGDLSIEDKSTLGQEYIAQAAENPTKSPVTWEKIVSWVRGKLRDIGVKISVSDKDVKVLLDRAAKYNVPVIANTNSQQEDSGIEYDELPQNVKGIVDKYGDANDKTEFHKKLEEAGYTTDYDMQSFGEEDGNYFYKIKNNDTRFSSKEMQDNLAKARAAAQGEEENTSSVEIPDDLKKYGDEFIDYTKSKNPNATATDVISEMESELGTGFTVEEAPGLYDYIRSQFGNNSDTGTESESFGSGEPKNYSSKKAISLMIGSIGENNEDAVLDGVNHRKNVGSDVAVGDVANSDKLILGLSAEDAINVLDTMKDIYKEKYLSKALTALKGLNKNTITLDKRLAFGIAIENEIKYFKEGIRPNEFNIKRNELNRIYAEVQKINVLNSRESSKALNTTKTLYNYFDNTAAQEGLLTKEQYARKQSILDTLTDFGKMDEAAENYEATENEEKQVKPAKDERKTKPKQKSVESKLKDILTELKDKLDKLDC